MDGNGESVEATNPILGTLKVSGQSITLLICVVILIIVSVIAWVLNAHAGDAKDAGVSVARELKEANKEVAQTLKESNKEISKVLNELAAAMREQNCLAQFSTAEEKSKNAELCKRISR